jgi:hypothetical protein
MEPSVLLQDEHLILTQNIKLLVINGSNLYYRRNQFINIVAITKMISALSDKYQYMIFFDLSIRGVWQASANPEPLKLDD